MAFQRKTGKVNLTEAEQVADEKQISQAAVPFKDFDEQDDIFDPANDGDATMNHMLDVDSASDSDREGGAWDTNKFLLQNIASSDGEITMASKRYGGHSRSGSEIDEPLGGDGFGDMEEDDFNGAMDMSLNQNKGRRSSVGIGRDDSFNGATGLNDSGIEYGTGAQQKKRNSMGIEGLRGTGDDDFGDFAQDDFGNDDFYNENSNDGRSLPNGLPPNLQNNNGIDGLAGLDFSDDEDNEDGTPSRKQLRDSLDGSSNGGVQWDLLNNNNSNTSPSDEKDINGNKRKTVRPGSNKATNSAGSRKKKKRKKMFKVSKATKVPNYTEMAANYWEDSTIEHGMPSRFNPLNSNFKDSDSDSNSDQDEEEDQDDPIVNEKQKKKRRRYLHRATAIHNVHERKKRKFTNLNNIVPKPSMGGAMPKEILGK